MHSIEFAAVLPVVLSECETWFLNLREKHNTWGFGNKVVGRILGPSRDEMTGGWKRLHNEELHKMYCPPSIITMVKSRRLNWAGHVANKKGSSR
jgi:hypothetical protein